MGVSTYSDDGGNVSHASLVGVGNNGGDEAWGRGEEERLVDY